VLAEPSVSVSVSFSEPSRHGWPTPDARPRRRPGVSLVALDDNVALYDDVGQLLILLNPSAAAVWEGCDGAGTLAELVERLSARYGADGVVVRHDVLETVRKLSELGLLAEGPEAARG